MGPYPRYTYANIRSAAAAFLKDHHPAGTIPVPIERIVEGKGIDIVPFPNFQSAYGVVGFTTSDLSAIYVEKYVYDHVETRYRFTLAHELGHVVLHADLYRGMAWSNVDEWARIIESIPEDQYNWLEWHANAFAGLVLVPDANLPSVAGECERTIRAALKDPEPEALQEFLAICVGRGFDVSPQVAAKRLEKLNE